MWIQCIIPCMTSELEFIELALENIGAASVTYRDAEDQPILEPAPGETPLWEKLEVVGLFKDVEAGAIKQALAPLLPQLMNKIYFEKLEDRVWETAWEDHFKPMSFGKRLWICPSSEEPPVKDAVNIILDPGLAFGTGTHPTTAMCLRWLDKIIQGQEIVIDYGCGSGILSLAAIKLGAKLVYAIDNDPQALLATRENAERNNIDPAKIICLSPEAFTAIKADVLVANILANPLMSLAKKFAGYLKEKGKIALSGILYAQHEEVIAAYKPWFHIEGEEIEEDWVSLSGRLA